MRIVVLVSGFQKIAIIFCNQPPMAQKIIDLSTGCNHSKVITDNNTGESLCSRCGLVFSEHMVDSRQEWRIFSFDNTNRGRTGDGVSLAKHDQGLSTIINAYDVDASGKPLSLFMKKTLKQLRTADRRSQRHASFNRNLIQAFSELTALKDKLALSNAIIEKTAYIYRKAVERKLVRGRSISSMIAASLYAACRTTETPRTLKDVAEASNIKKKEISRCYRILFQELELKMPILDSTQCIAKISSKLDLPEKIKRQAANILKSIKEHDGTAGKDPMGLAATALYLSCALNGEDKTQREIAEASNVTEVTIRNRVKDLKSANYLDL